MILDASCPHCSHSFQFDKTKVTRGVSLFDEAGVALLDRVARMLLVVNGNGDARQAPRASVARGECWHA